MDFSLSGSGSLMRGQMMYAWRPWMSSSFIFSYNSSRLPGMMMSMLRMNVPAVFLYGGTIKPGHYMGKDITVQEVYEAVGAHAAGKITDKELRDIECSACPGAGSCGGQFTANTMACVAEAIGLALPGSSSPPAEDLDRDHYAEECGKAVLALMRKKYSPARYRHPKIPGERGGDCGRHRRINQRRLAFACVGQRSGT
jgi:hypothetical protein